MILQPRRLGKSAIAAMLKSAALESMDSDELESLILAHEKSRDFASLVLVSAARRILESKS